MADILIIDDQDRLMDLLARFVPEHRYLGPARSYAEAVEILEGSRRSLDLVLLDVHFDRPADELLGVEPSMSDREVEGLRRRQGLLILRQLRRRVKDLPVILTTARDEISIEDLAEAEGADETTYFLEDDHIDVRSLKAQIARILDARQGHVFEGPIYWGRHLSMQRLRQRLSILARGRLPIMLLGPTGTGKSMLARHFVHPRTGRSGRFVSVDLSTVPRDLAAAHLFGAVRGAYTGAVGDRMGAFESANGGTLFLDEIGNLPSDGQKLLLSVLQEGTITRIGDLKERPVDVKLVVATCEDLPAKVAQGEFRADLYMRLNPAAAVRLPPLSERGLDLGALLRHSLGQALKGAGLTELVREVRAMSRLGEGSVKIHSGGGVPDPERGTLWLLWPERTMRLLRGHAWPGNLREFAMVTENAALVALAEAASVEGGQRADVVQVRPKLVQELLHVARPPTTRSGKVVPVTLSPAESLNQVSQDCERQYFRRLWFENEGDFSAMAALLLGDPDAGRKVQLRFNQLGLKVRDLKAELA
ncbi:MAG: hypothetical protein EA397_11100 [Deltaproteobacteria bacterium]|nr:MAG: hypothetical protein EA397_11100 [Deltaproteobacteria bacterium]